MFIFQLLLRGGNLSAFCYYGLRGRFVQRIELAQPGAVNVEEEIGFYHELLKLPRSSIGQMRLAMLRNL